MPRRPPLAAALLLLLAVGCSGELPSGPAVEPVNGVAVPVLQTCRVLKSRLPDTLLATEKVAAQPESDTTAAWGDPPITLRCGVDEGSARDEPYTFNGVQWAMHDDGASRRWTSVGREVNVAFSFPDAYDSQAEALASLAAVLTSSLPAAP